MTTDSIPPRTRKQEQDRAYYYSHMTLVRCRDCPRQWKMSNSNVPRWGGRCRRCSLKHIANLPHVRAAASERARQQLLRQGGVPNARHFNSERTKGAKNVNWKGGPTRLSWTVRQTAEYATWRKSVFERDNYTCQKCGAKGVELHADHIRPVCAYPELAYELDNGQTLCVPCHKATPTYGKRALAFRRALEKRRGLMLFSLD